MGAGLLAIASSSALSSSSGRVQAVAKSLAMPSGKMSRHGRRRYAGSSVRARALAVSLIVPL
ncbi:hypothetical protein BG74_00595 [Sodalis-like endosymbiont of Proechinophthirus fluctus]|nr:hypothetical protein BG74_00595 [Sodalis-like endosymbiont of Proechinophthirus fluctus]